MAKAAIYARFSCDKQRDESIEDQVRVCRDEAERRGDSVVAVYSDAALSGRSDHRPQFLRMISDAAGKKPFGRVYVYKLDRFARDRFDAALYRRKLRNAGVELVSACEHVPDGPEGIILEGVLDAVNEWYSANLSQNVKRGMDGNAASCRTNGVRVYGFRTGADGRYEEDPAEGPVVRRIFNAIAGGSTIAGICRSLNDDGLRTRRGALWSKASITRMVYSDKYLGVYQWGSVRVPGGMPRIVDEDTVLRARDACSLRGFVNENVHTYPLSGLLYTEDGASITGTFGTGKSGRRYYYYRCAATGQIWPQSVLDDVVFGAISSSIRRPRFAEVVADLAMEGQREAMADTLAELEALKKRSGSIDREQRSVIDVAAKVGADDAILAKIAALRKERADVDTRIAEIEASGEFIDRDMVVFWLEKMLEEKNITALAQTFVSRITLTKDGAARAVFDANTQVEAGVCFRVEGAPIETSSKHRVPWGGAVLEALPGGFVIEFPLRAAA